MTTANKNRKQQPAAPAPVAVRAEGKGAAPVGSETTNRDPSNPVPACFGGGIDTVYVSLFGVVKTPEAVFRWLETAKAEAQENRDHLTIQDDIVHHPTAGYAFGRQCRWRVTFRGLTFMISSNFDSQGTTTPTMQVQIGGKEILIHGYQVCLEHAFEFCSIMNFECTSNRVNRLDICVDLPVSMQEIKIAWAEERIITQARKWHLYGRNEDGNPAETLSYGQGSSDVKLRIYDKVRETEADEIKRQLLLQRLWNNELPEHSTRIEFQVSGQWLKQNFNVCQLIEVESRLQDIANYLTTEWFRISSEHNDRQHQERKPIAPIWKQVQDSFVQIFGKPQRGRTKAPQLAPKKEKLQQMLFGILESIQAHHGYVPVSVDDLFHSLRNAIANNYHHFIARVSEKRKVLVKLLGAEPYYEKGLEYELELL